MKKIIYTINIIILISFLNACGGASDTQEGYNVSNIKVIDCNLSNQAIATNDCNGYTCINSNDTLVSNSNDTRLEIIHLSNNDKKVCVKNGSAHILR